MPTKTFKNIHKMHIKIINAWIFDELMPSPREIQTEKGSEREKKKTRAHSQKSQCTFSAMDAWHTILNEIHGNIIRATDHFNKMHKYFFFFLMRHLKIAWKCNIYALLHSRFAISRSLLPAHSTRINYLDFVFNIARISFP